MYMVNLVNLKNVHCTLYKNSGGNHGTFLNDYHNHLLWYLYCTLTKYLHIKYIFFNYYLEVALVSRLFVRPLVSILVLCRLVMDPMTAVAFALK